MMHKEFTGRHMALVLVGGFAVVIAVNFYMASLAIGGFGGVVVENSYVASQKFNGWLEEARDSERLGYSFEVGRDDEGHLLVTTEHVPHYARVSADLRRPLGAPEDTSITFAPEGQGRYVSEAAIPAGRWIARIAIDNGGERWVRETELP